MITGTKPKDKIVDRHYKKDTTLSLAEKKINISKMKISNMRMAHNLAGT